MTQKTLTNEVSGDLARRISTGQWPIGGKLPTEAELCARYRCSRVTIRRALAILETAGMIERHPRIGTTVLSKGSGMAFLYELSTLDDLEQLGADHARKILAEETLVADKTLAGEMNVPPGSVLIGITEVRRGNREGDVPLNVTKIFFRAVHNVVLATARTHPDELFIHLLERASGALCTTVRQSVHAEALPEAYAQILSAMSGEPALRILRRYATDSGETLMYSESWHPGSRYAFSVNISRSGRTR